MPRVVLLLPTATYRAADFVRAAQALGVEVVVACDARQALAESMGDRALVVDFGRPDDAARRIVEAARVRPVDAVVAVDEPGVVPAALASAVLGLAHNPPSGVEATRDKARQRRVLERAGVPQPAFRFVPPGAAVAAAAGEVGFPVVVKPVSLSGSRGVIRADTAPDAERAAERARGIVTAATGEADAPLLVEQYVDGAEVAVEGLLRGGRLTVLAVFDKPDPMPGPYFDETILVTPSRLAPDVLRRLEEVTAAAAGALGLREGPVHAELRVGGTGEVWFLEMAARTIGGLCSRTLRFGTGTSLEEVVLRHAIGLPEATVQREHGASGVLMVPIPSAGVLVGVRGQDEARAVPGIVGLEMTIRPGTPVQPLPEGERYLGFVFARGERPEDVESSLREAWARLEVVVDP